MTSRPLLTTGAEVAVGAAVTIVVHFAFFRPRPERAVRRMQRSYAARAHEVAEDIAELFEATVRSGDIRNSNPRADRQLQRQLLRLNEAALLIDAQLNAPGAIPAGWSAATLHQRLFDAEAGLGNVARFALEIAGRGFPAQVDALVGAALAGIRDADFTAVLDAAAGLRELLEDHDEERTGLTADGRVLLHRFAASVTDFAVALRAFRRYPAGQAPDDSAYEPAEFTTQVATFGGWLPGSSFIARTAGFLAVTVAARHYARNLLLDASTRYVELDAAASAELAAARRRLDDSIAAITTALAAGGTPDGTRYVRSASLFAQVADMLPDDAPLSRPQLALRDLQLLDGALAEAARWADVPVTEAEEAQLA
jgi:hypothetical protein